MKSFGSIGDIGDSVAFLPCLKSVGSGVLYCVDRPGSRPFSDRIPLIKRLFESQSYVEAVLPWNGEYIDYDASDFRSAGMPFGVTLGRLHADYVGLSPNLNERWLDVPADPRSKGKIVVARSPRYRNLRFPWASIVQQYSKDILFVGLPSEYEDFCRMFGDVDYCSTNDLYEVACLIEGCDTFIGNQSSPNAICEGLKHKSILEVCLRAPDCIYPRDNATYCVDGSMDVEILGKRFQSSARQESINLQTTPPGGWVIELNDKRESSYSHPILLGKIQAHYRVNRTDAAKKFLELVEVPVSPEVQAVLNLTHNSSH